ncbi:MAG: glycoside hydrolase [Actinobacteria bacterium]|nr:glycoside hydrolase [Actinomycetota bacterium]
MRSRRPLALMLTTALLGSVPAHAADPESSSLRAPQAAGDEASTSWTGTSPPGVNPTSECSAPGEASEDRHEITIEVPAGTYDRVGVDYKFQITWVDENQDLILTIEGPEGEVLGSSDGGSPAETVFLPDLPAGTYTAVTCAFAAGATEYEGTLIATAKAKGATALPAAADPRGLAFSAAVPADIQRDEGEPLIEIDGDGTIYTCGPTGFSQANEYAQASTDGGDQFNLLGEPPRGQLSVGGGGGDCGLATAPERNDEGNFQLAYTGLSGLLNFATATSADRGATFRSSPISESRPGVDRQWNAFTDADTVFLTYNQVIPRAVTAQRSDDGGLTYGEPVVVSPNPDFPGPVRSLPPELNPGGDLPALYYPWSRAGSQVMLAVSLDEGDTWNNCLLVEGDGDVSQLFVVADHDTNGDLYVVYSDNADFNTRMVRLANEKLVDCVGGTDDTVAEFKAPVGATAPVVVNREPVRTSLFPWIAVGEPGRVAVSYYGSETDAPADSTDAKTWHVYVAQSLDANRPDATFSQVQVTTHPNHYDQICLFGITCSTGGDRSLVDFFSIDLNPVTGEIVGVFNRAHKQPGQAAGQVSTPLVFRQIGGPSLAGGTVSNPELVPLRTRSEDPEGDAVADYSSQLVPPGRVPVAAADVLANEIGAAIDLGSGEPLDGGGFTVTIDVADLSDDALQQALQDAKAQSLLWIFRYVDGYRYSAVSARWNPFEGFTFGHNGFVGTAWECGTPGAGANQDQCLQYPGGTPVQGDVDQDTGRIRMTVPLELLVGLTDDQGPGETPEEVPAQPGTRIYTAATFAVANPFSPTQEAQSFLEPMDNTPAMDFLVPGGQAAPGHPDPAPPAPGAPDDRPLPATGAPAWVLMGLLGLAAGEGLRRRSLRATRS